MSGGQFPCPIVFRGPTGSAGQLAATHSQAFESWYANCPGLKVIVPSNPYDAKGLLKSAIRDDDPVIFMESEQMYGDKGQVPEEEYLIPIGKAEVTREGSDVTIVSFGKIMKEVVKAAEKLKEENINVEVIDLRTVRPLDYDTVIKSVKKYFNLKKIKYYDSFVDKLIGGLRGKNRFILANLLKKFDNYFVIMNLILCSYKFDIL